MTTLKEQLARLDREAGEPAHVCLKHLTHYPLSKRRCPICGSILTRVGNKPEPKTVFDDEAQPTQGELWND